MAEDRQRLGDTRDWRGDRASGGEGGDDLQSGSGNRDDGTKPSLFERREFKIGAGLVIAILIIGGIVWYLIARQYEETDDAFIDTHIVHISPQIAGQVIAIPVNDNQLVRQGELLVAIDPSDPTAKLNQAEAQLAAAEMQVNQDQSNEASQEALARDAEANLARYNYLKRIAPSAVSQDQIDQAVAQDKSAVAQRDAAKAQIKNAQAVINVNRAAIVSAKINLGYTRIVAPVDGHVTQRTVALGNYVTPGQELLAIVPLRLWVTANFKETQLDHMRAGQPVTVSVDACGDADVRGHVDSIQRGAGQAFGILPPENATGNFVKVVQRVPVKILLDHVPPGCVIGPGMSVEPSVKVR